MKHTQFPPIDDASVSFVASRQELNSGKSFFSSLFDALHESRRLQAARAIQQHRHLIGAHKADAAKTTGAPSLRREVPRIVLDTANSNGKPGTISFNAKLIIAIILAGFGVLHFIADGALSHASTAPPTEDGMPLPNRD